MPYVGSHVLGGQAHGEVPVDLVRLRPGLALGVGIDQEGVARPISESRSPQIIGSVAHALCAAGHDDVGQTGHYGLGPVVDRLQTRAALAHHRVGRHFHRQARSKRGDTRQVGRIGALLGLPHDHFVDRLRLHAGPPDGRLDDDSGELLRLHVSQTAADPAAGRPDRADDDDFVHISPTGRLTPAVELSHPD